jgi:Polyketide cyclase / dehydrase and lipid transport
VQVRRHKPDLRLTARAVHTLTEDVPAPPDVVRDFYTDLDNLTFVHPLVVSVRGMSRTETAGGYRQTYRVRDRIPLGRYTLPISYVARLDVPRAGDVIAEARQFPRVRLHSTMTFEPAEAGTRVTERMRIEAPRPLAAVTTREAVKAHIAMLAAIRRRFEAP